MKTIFALAGLALAGAGCSAVDPLRLASDPDWSVVEETPVRLQAGETDCGAAALAMVLARWGRSEDGCRRLDADGGIRAGALRDCARETGLQAYVVRGTLEDLQDEVAKRHPVVVGLLKGAVSHYEVVAGLNDADGELLLVDPARGWRRERRDRFLEEWEGSGRVTLVVFP